jgi:hypothetical protein
MSVAAVPLGRSDPRAIVINVEGPENICFAIIPFTEEFLDLSTAILRAANSLGLLYVRVDERQADYEFPRDVRERIKAARVVVGVCSPDSRYQGSNPNVVYELGMAHAWGKPTLILTTHPNLLPSDLAAVQALRYSDDEVATGASHLVMRIKDAIRDLLVRSNLLTDGSRRDVCTANRRQRMLLDPDFWANFKAILEFCKEINEQIKLIYTGHLDSLVREVDAILYDDNPSLKKVRDLKEHWRTYRDFYDGITRRLVFDRDLSNIDQCFHGLPNDAEGDMVTAIEKARDFYGTMKDLLRKYPGQHGTAETVVSDNLEMILGDKAAARSVQKQIETLLYTAKMCMIQADGLMGNLIKMML